MKTNACRALDTLHIHYELRDYEVDPSDLSAGSVAAKIGLPPSQVFKTLAVVDGHSFVCFAVIPGDAELSLKALARTTGKRKLELAPLKDVQALTGYIRGGVTALGAKKRYPTYLDEAALSFEAISISAGVRGTQIWLAPADYIRATDATVAALRMS